MEKWRKFSLLLFFFLSWLLLSALIDFLSLLYAVKWLESQRDFYRQNGIWWFFFLPLFCVCEDFTFLSSLQPSSTDAPLHRPFSIVKSENFWWKQKPPSVGSFGESLKVSQGTIFQLYKNLRRSSVLSFRHPPEPDGVRTIKCDKIQFDREERENLANEKIEQQSTGGEWKFFHVE